MTSALEEFRMNQYLSDPNFRPEMLLYLRQGVVRDVADLVPTGFFVANFSGKGGFILCVLFLPKKCSTRRFEFANVSCYC